MCERIARDIWRTDNYLPHQNSCISPCFSYIPQQKYDEFQLGTLYEFDVTDYTQVDYTPLLDKLEKEINDNK